MLLFRGFKSNNKIFFHKLYSLNLYYIQIIQHLQKIVKFFHKIILNLYMFILQFTLGESRTIVIVLCSVTNLQLSATFLLLILLKYGMVIVSEIKHKKILYMGR